MNTINRTGKRSLKFEGELLAIVDGNYREPEKTRWHSIFIWQSEGDKSVPIWKRQKKLVVSIIYHSRLFRELEYSDAEVFENEASAAEYLENYDFPNQANIGIATPEFQQRELDALKLDWKHLVSRIITKLGHQTIH